MKIGIVGATGEVGRMMLRVMEERNLDITDLTLMASSKSSGQKLTYRGRQYHVLTLTKELIQNKYDYLLFSAGGAVSQEYAPIAEEAGNPVIDNSSAFRSSHHLIVPEINGHLIRNYQGIIANPNCSTIQLVLSLYPLHLRYNLKKLVVSTYQSVSGAGHKGIEALIGERENRGSGSIFSKEIDFNVIPQIGTIDKTGYCQEELKMHYETKKILALDNLKIAATTVRVPVLYGHSESVFASFSKPVDIQECIELFRECSYMQYHDDVFTPKEIGDSDKVHICRLRKGGEDNTLLFWNVAHNIRIGAATNAVNIMFMLMDFKQEGGING